MLVLAFWSARAIGQLRCEHGGTNSLTNTCADNKILVGDGTSLVETTITQCLSSQKLQYNSIGNTFSCVTDTDAESKCAANEVLDGDGFCNANVHGCAANELIDTEDDCHDVLNDGGATTGALSVRDTTDAASVTSLKVQGGDRTTPTDLDKVVTVYELEDGTNALDEFCRTVVTAAEILDADEHGRMEFLCDIGGIPQSFLRFFNSSSGATVIINDDFLPEIDFEVDGDTGIVMYVNAGTDSVSFGSATQSGLVAVDGNSDEVQLTVQANSVQTAKVLVVENSAGTDKFTVDSAGSTVSAGTTTIGDGTGNDYLEATEETTNPTCAAGNYRVWANSTDNKWKKCENGTITDLDTGGSGGTECSTAGCALNANTTVQDGAAPVVNAAGELGVDSTDDQFVYFGGAERVLGYKGQACVRVENLVAADDNFLFWSTAAAVTITDVWCRYEGTGTTVATIALEDSAGNAMTHTGPTCVTGATNATVQGVTAANALVIGEGLRFDVTNTPAPTTDDYTICVLFTLTRT